MLWEAQDQYGEVLRMQIDRTMLEGHAEHLPQQQTACPHRGAVTMIPEPERLQSVTLPMSVWRLIYTMLSVELDMFKEGSDEYRNHKATIELIGRQTNLTPADLPEDIP